MTNFLFMDEGKGGTTDIFSLTGLVVPVARYADLRTQFYELLGWAIRPEPNTIDLATKELRGSRMLEWHKDATDAQK